MTSKNEQLAERDCRGCVRQAERIKELEAELLKRDSIWLPDKDARIKELESDRDENISMQVGYEKQAARIKELEAERDKLRRALDEIKVLGYERGMKWLHDIALKELEKK